MKKNSIIKIAAFLSVLLLFGFFVIQGIKPRTERSSLYPATTLQERIANSDLVVIGEYTGKNRLLQIADPNNKGKVEMVFTEYDISVTDILKEETGVRAGDRIAFRQQGGDNKKLYVENMDWFDLQEGNHLFFLQKAAEGNSYFTGGDYYLVACDPQDAVVSEDKAKRAYPVVMDTAPPPQGKEESLDRRDFSLEDLKAETARLDQINQATGKNKISIEERMKEQLANGEITQDEYDNIRAMHKKIYRIVE